MYIIYKLHLIALRSFLKLDARVANEWHSVPKTRFLDETGLALAS